MSQFMDHSIESTEPSTGRGKCKLYQLQK